MRPAADQESTLEALLAKASRTACGLLHRVTSPRLSILIFHRVHARADTILPSEPDATRFALLMRFVARSFRVMTLGEAASRLANEELPPRALVVTFDDGYADNVEVALPILQRYGVPASFFISTGFLDGGRMWNDSVIEIIRACAADELDLESFGIGRRSLSGAVERRSVIGELLSRIKYLALAERDEAIVRLQRLAGVRDLPNGLMMRSEQVRQLQRAGMEIGAHTAHHPILTTLAPADAEREISSGRQRLEEIIDTPVDVFAYPNGKPVRDYDQTHVAILRRLGFRAAVSTAPGVARAGDGLLELPRFTPWGDSLSAWALRLMANQRNVRYQLAAAQNSPRG